MSEEQPIKENKKEKNLRGGKIKHLKLEDSPRIKQKFRQSVENQKAAKELGLSIVDYMHFKQWGDPEKIAKNRKIGRFGK